MTLERHFRLACLFTRRWSWEVGAVASRSHQCGKPDAEISWLRSSLYPQSGLYLNYLQTKESKEVPWMHPYQILNGLPLVTHTWCQTCCKNSLFPAENIKPYSCYEISVYALSGDQRGGSSIRANSKHKGESWDFLPRFALFRQFGFGGWRKPPVFYFAAPLSGPHINAISEEKGSVLISWNEVPAQEQMGCLLHYRIYWKEQDSNSQPQLCGMCEKQMQWGLFYFGVGDT